jgi:hypothetical protein
MAGRTRACRWRKHDLVAQIDGADGNTEHHIDAQIAPEAFRPQKQRFRLRTLGQELF